MKTKKKKEYVDFFDHADKNMSRENAKKADKRAEEVISFLHLADARKRMGLRQTDIKAFSQADVSKIEHRSDIKLSTLIEYMRSIGMGLKIIGIPKDDEREEFLILKAK